MVDSVCLSISFGKKYSKSECPICQGIIYKAIKYDQLCPSCRKSFVWTKSNY